VHFNEFPPPYDPRFNPLTMIRMGSEFEESDALGLAENYVPSDVTERPAKLFELAQLMRIALRTKPAATLEDVQAIVQRMNIAWMRDVLKLSPN
jgi:hypothetical protein